MYSKPQKAKTHLVGPRERGRVLVITDDRVALPDTLFETAGLDVVGVSNGVAALLSLQRSRPHIVIANNRLEGISIKEIARMLSQGGERVPLLLVGNEPSTTARRQEALALGAFEYLQLPQEVELLALRAEQLVEMQQTIERLRSEADLDALTGLANRRRFRTALNREVERWRRYSVPCALLLLDIDYMKAINDRFGHPTGDMVIRHIANVLSGVSRDNDTAARLGGEEFALLLANISSEKGVQAAERLRAALAEQALEGVGAITVSIGVAGCPANATSDRSLYAASDRALYVAKNEGRNRVAVAPLLQEKLPGV
jgi:diguanylate cyclase (GGDEF)-like protein